MVSLTLYGGQLTQVVNWPDTLQLEVYIRIAKTNNKHENELKRTKNYLHAVFTEARFCLFVRIYCALNKYLLLPCIGRLCIGRLCLVLVGCRKLATGVWRFGVLTGSWRQEGGDRYFGILLGLYFQSWTTWMNEWNGKFETLNKTLSYISFILKSVVKITHLLINAKSNCQHLAPGPPFCSHDVKKKISGLF